LTLALDRDAAAALVAAACAATAITLLASEQSRSGASVAIERPAIATVAEANRPLRLRAAEELGWRNIAAGAAVHERDAVFVPPGTEARLAFKDGTTLELDERSLVVIEAPPRGRKTVALRQGSFAGVAGQDGMVVSTPQGTAQVAPKGQLQVALGQGGKVELEVVRGEATIGGKTLAIGQRGELSAQGFAEAAPWPVKLGAPERGKRVFFRGGPPPVALDWAGELPEGAVVEIARDRGFAFVLQQKAASEQALTFAATEPGVYWWRVVDAAHAPLSEARRFSLQEDVPPAPITPRPGEVVLAPDGKGLKILWAEVRGVSRYRVELSASPDFSKVELERTVTGATQLVLDQPLAEAGWYWRVRSADEDRGDSGPSEAVGFRLIHKRILDAPELLAPEIEVTPEGPKKK
jgi:FecR protein